MLKKVKTFWHRISSKLYAFTLCTLGKLLITLLAKSCRWTITGKDEFIRRATHEKCIIMLWHNRLVMTPYVLVNFAPGILFTAFVSNSRDGALISAVVESYPQGRTIRVPHQSRHEALRTMIKKIEQKDSVIVITPDGPKGPCYTMKPGLPLAALETEALIFSLTWTSSSYWELKTWDRLRIPKPFSTIEVTFGPPLSFNKEDGITIDEAKHILENELGTLHERP